MQISLSHLSHASFLLHVFLDMEPDAALGEVSFSSLFKFSNSARPLRRQLLQINSAKQGLSDGFIVFVYVKGHSVKGIVHPKMKILSLITHPHAVLNP